MSLKAYGSLIQYGDTADIATAATWTTVAKAKSIKPGKSSEKSIDTTHLTSPDEHEEAVPGLATGGEFEVMAQYDKTATDAVNALFRIVKAWRLVYPDLSGWKWNGWISEIGDEEVVNGDIVRTTLKIKVTGKLVHVTGGLS